MALAPRAGSPAKTWPASKLEGVEAPLRLGALAAKNMAVNLVLFCEWRRGLLPRGVRAFIGLKAEFRISCVIGGPAAVAIGFRAKPRAPRWDNKRSCRPVPRAGLFSYAPRSPAPWS